MSMTMNQLRKKFEDANRLPDGVTWSDDHNQYLDDCCGVACKPVNIQWLGYRQGHKQGVVDHNEAIMKLTAKVSAIDSITFNQANSIKLLANQTFLSLKLEKRS